MNGYYENVEKGAINPSLGFAPIGSISAFFSRSGGKTDRDRADAASVTSARSRVPESIYRARLLIRPSPRCLAWVTSLRPPPDTFPLRMRLD